jgi:hypothetical protein
MPKLILTADEEIQYLRELQRIQEMMPEVEIQVISQTVTNQDPFIRVDSTIGNEFRTFLRVNNLKVSMSEIGHS